MQTKEVAMHECAARIKCDGDLTNHTVETITRGGNVVSFYCCLKCRATVIHNLEFQRDEMELDAEVAKNLHIKQEIIITDDVKLQTAQGRALYNFTPSHKAKQEQMLVAAMPVKAENNATLKALLAAMASAATPERESYISAKDDDGDVDEEVADNDDGAE